MRACQARLAQYAGSANPMHVSLVAAYDSIASDVSADDERRHGGGHRAAFRDRQAGEYEAVCWFDADAFGATPRQVAGGPPPGALHDRVEEIVRPDGVPVGYRVGHKTTMNPEPIPSGDGR
jgi:hypothetical protein